MKCLVTGAEGFVGTYLVRELLKRPGCEVLGLGLREQTKTSSFAFRACDLRDSANLARVLDDFAPDVVFHLAGQAFVPKAIEDPIETLEINVGGTLNLLESLAKSGRKIRFLYVSSADVYGNLKPENLPVSERAVPIPLNPYSSSKVAAETYCLQYSRSSESLETVVARPFNHIGIGQNPKFVVPNFCRQILEVQSLSRSVKGSPKKIMVGDLNPTRDFLHVQDVISAYVLLSEKGKSGEIYNICSGTETKISQILNWLIEFTGEAILPEVDPSRIRPAEMLRSRGDNSKLRDLGWEPKISVKDAVREIYEHMRYNDFSLS
ncbi:NAD-dependent epimerase/dehydratase family protein [Leptospira fluminis]|uniref:NAD-dependent epimerase/dehydratase family protein n=1 Tax=Leptospira fluminis TaxID=2484979 RepID=A0A4V3JEH2_9LEPT|nr:GDP-mannose 4,6-dehydratase [Leptospira fluminis]TGK18114.1 NAD-dependent epimerase/dehydratase family protein [Leptospira fluminis]